MILRCTCALRRLLFRTHYVGRQRSGSSKPGLNGQDVSPLSPGRRNRAREPWLSWIQGREMTGLNIFPIHPKYSGPSKQALQENSAH